VWADLDLALPPPAAVPALPALAAPVRAAGPPPAAVPHAVNTTSAARQRLRELLQRRFAQPLE
jgi:hypothetical protein